MGRWRLDSVCRNMGVLFVSSGTDAAVHCSDPSFAYFLISGCLVPVADRPAKRATSPLDSDNAVDTPPRVFGSVILDASSGGCTSEQGTPREASIGRKGHNARQLQQAGVTLATGAYSSGHPISGGTRIPCGTTERDATCRENDCNQGAQPGCSLAENVSNAKKNDMLQSSGERGRLRCEGAPLQLGYTLDPYLKSACDEAPRVAHDKRLSQSASPRVCSGGKFSELSWRIEVRAPACIGRVSRRALEQIRADEPREDIEARVAMLKSTACFGQGFSLVTLRRLASLMERHEHSELSRVHRKGAVADKVCIVVSGEAVRMGDRCSDSREKASSLRIRRGDLFGAEEAMAGRLTYGSNLVAMKDLVSLSVPAKAFVEAAVGVCNEAVERLHVKASLMNSDARRSALRSQVTERRPFTAAVAGSERSSAVNSRSFETGGASTRLAMQVRASRTPVRLTPVPFLSKTAARNYARATGVQANAALDQRDDTVVSGCNSPTRDPPDSASLRKTKSSQPGTTDGCGRFNTEEQRARKGEQPGRETQHELHEGKREGRERKQNRSGRERRGREGGTVGASSTKRPSGADERQDDARSFQEKATPSQPKLERTEALSTDSGCPLLAGSLVALRDVDKAISPPTHGTATLGGSDETAAWSTSPSAHEEQDAGKEPSHYYPLCRHEQESRPRSSAPTPPLADPLRRPAHHRGACPATMTLPSGWIPTDSASPGMPPEAIVSPRPAQATVVSRWEDRDFAAAKRAVSGRSERVKACRNFSARGCSATAMIAARRAFHGPYVMSKMGNARARVTWRPLGGFNAAAMSLAQKSRPSRKPSGGSANLVCDH